MFSHDLVGKVIVSLALAGSIMAAHKAGAAECDSDLSCAIYTIDACEDTQEPFDCAFGELPARAIALACTAFAADAGFDALACVVYRNTVSEADTYADRMLRDDQ